MIFDFDTIFKVGGQFFIIFKQDYRQTRDGIIVHLCLRPHQVAAHQVAGQGDVRDLVVGSGVTSQGQELVVTEVQVIQEKYDPAPADLKPYEVFDISRRVLGNPTVCLSLADPLLATKTIELERARDTMLLRHAAEGHNN